MIAGIETGGTKVVCALIDPESPTEPAHTVRFPTTTPSETLARIEEFLREADARHGLDAIGIASFGPVNVDSSREKHGWITGTSKPGWANISLIDGLPTASRVPTVVLSDVTGAALGEQRWGAGRGVASVAYATFGTGVGIGVVVEGKPLHGNGYPEFGHLLIRRHPLDDYAGGCPFHGDCLEGLAAGPAVIARWGGDSSHLPPEQLPLAFEILGYYVAQAAAAVAYSSGVGRVVLGGGVLKAPELVDEARQQLLVVTGGPHAGHPIDSDPSDFLLSPQLGDMSGVVGAATAAMEVLASTWV